MATVDITEAEFGALLEDHSIVLVDFWAGWCRPCQAFAPVYEAVSEKHDDVVFAKVDTEAEQGLARAAGIASIPTLMAFRDKVLVYSQPGAIDAGALSGLVDAVKGLDMDAVRAELAGAEA